MVKLSAERLAVLNSILIHIQSKLPPGCATCRHFPDSQMLGIFKRIPETTNLAGRRELDQWCMQADFTLCVTSTHVYVLKNRFGANNASLMLADPKFLSKLDHELQWHYKEQNLFPYLKAPE